jgi:glycosyltransferase involved in cell wall biosynthesis
MKRVLVLIKGLGRGGAEQLLVNAAPHLDTARFEYGCAYTLPEKGDLSPELEKAGLPVRCLGTGTTASWIRGLRAHVRRTRPDLIHAHSPSVAAVARLALPRRDLRMVYTEHNVWQSYHPVTAFANLATYARNDHVFAVSDEVSASIRYPEALRFRRMPPVETLHHGIDAASISTWGGPDGVRAEFGIPAEAPLVATIGSFKPQKDHPNLIRAMVDVRREIPDARLILVGDGAGRERIERDLSTFGLEDSVVLAGYREDARRIAAACDVFVLSSRHEGLSIALLEAMALNKPVVVTRVGGLPEVVEDGRQGFVVPPREPATLARAISDVLSDDALRVRMGKASGERARAFDIRTAVARMEQVYEDLLR